MDRFFFFFKVKFQFSVAVDYNIWPLHGNQFPSLDFTNVWNGIQIRYSSHYVCVHTCQSKPFVVHNKVPCIPMVRSSDRSEGEVWVYAREWEAAISQPAKQEGVWVQQFPGCVEILWGCPAPEVWTDGFGGAHRKVLGESVVLMFTASWLNHWGGLLKRKYVCVSLCVGDAKSKMVLFCPPPRRPFCLSCFSCRTAGHDYKKAIMICLTVRISESASSQQNEFQSKLREWHRTSYSKKRWNVNSPQSHYASIIHSVIVGELQQNCQHRQRKNVRNKQEFHQKVQRSLSFGIE